MLQLEKNGDSISISSLSLINFLILCVIAGCFLCALHAMLMYDWFYLPLLDEV